METGAELVRVLDQQDGVASPRPLLFLDADLEDTARNAAPLVPPVLAGEADMTIAILPPQSQPGGGRGLVVNLSRKGIASATGFTATQPLSGQRCLTRKAFDAAPPLAPGFGVETGADDRPAAAGLPGPRGRVRPAPPGDRHGRTGSAAPGPAVPRRRARARAPAGSARPSLRRARG